MTVSSLIRASKYLISPSVYCNRPNKKVFKRQLQYSTASDTQNRFSRLEKMVAPTVQIFLLVTFCAIKVVYGHPGQELLGKRANLQVFSNSVPYMFIERFGCWAAIILCFALLRNFLWTCSCIVLRTYCNVPKYSSTKLFCCKLPEIQTKSSNHRLFCQNSAKGIANSEDPDQTAPLGAVWSGSALFA